MKQHLLITLGLSLAAIDGFAQRPTIVPQPTACILSSFSSSGNLYWQNMILKITNNCKQPVDFQNSAITFSNKINLNTNFWGTFEPVLTYPTNNLQITSQAQPDGNYLASLTLQFNEEGARSILPDGQSFTIAYGAAKADYLAGSSLVYLNSAPATGSIDLMNSTAKPATVSQNYALVDLNLNGQKVSQVQVPWSGHQLISGLAAGTYAVSPLAINDSTGNVYTGSANPASVAVTSGTTASSVITYKATQVNGAIKLSLQALPNELSGYTKQPSITLKRVDTGSSTLATVPWGSFTVVSSLANGVSYNFSTPAITFNGYNCVSTFNPTSATAASTPATVNLTYTCKQVAQDNVSVSISGAPTSAASVNVTFTPTANLAPVVQKITLTSGTGSAVVQLTDGAIYTVSADDISGYTVGYSPQPLTASASSSETITYSQNSSSGGARIIAYMPGWKTPPPATAIASAGYTHVMVAFGVFSTSTPGQIASAFETISASYIQSLQNAGIKVLLSLGGASTSIPNTTVSFHDALAAASSPAVFEQTFTASMESLISQYHFDGFDFDIESGLKGSGTFANPTGDIAVLANIINTMHGKHPDLLLTLAPQIANVAATSGFDGVWGNYASLIMQTHQSLAWVGIQVYNSGCAFGIDQVCYDPNITNTPNASVAFATDLLANWPAKTSSGQATGFQPYISYLTPGQVILGYPAPNASGVSDGAPAAVIGTIKRAIQCLRTGVTGCGTYLPPKAYPGIGGVFEWEITYDQNNNYNFAKSLKDCVINGNCS
jgi:chitinase